MKKVLFFVFSLFICTTYVFADYSINDINEDEYLFPMEKYIIDGNYGDYGTKNLIFEYYDYGYEEEPMYTYVYPETTTFKNAFCTEDVYCITNGVVEIEIGANEWSVEEISYNSASDYVLFKLYAYGPYEDPIEEAKAPSINTRLLDSGGYVAEVLATEIYEDSTIVVRVTNDGNFWIDEECSYKEEDGYYIFNPDEGPVKLYFNTPGDHVWIEVYVTALGYSDSEVIAAEFIIPEPSSPTDPTDPVDPTEPSDPTDPTNPDEPKEPEEPTEPTDSGDASEVSKDNEKSTDSLINPNTIDYVLLLGGVLIISLLLIVTLRKNRRLFIK